MRVIAGTPQANGVYQVLCDGKDVTADCLEADDEGEVVLLKRRMNGRPAAAFGRCIRFHRKGKVEIRYKDGLFTNGSERV